jgi:hypothetical protein
MDVLAKSSIAVTEAFGDILLPTAIDKNGAEGFVESLGITGGLEEEKATRMVVHSGAHACELFLSRNIPGSIEHCAAAGDVWGSWKKDKQRKTASARRCRWANDGNRWMDKRARWPQDESKKDSHGVTASREKIRIFTPRRVRS